MKKLDDIGLTYLLLLAFTLLAAWAADGATVTGRMLDINGSVSAVKVRFIPTVPVAVGTNTYLDYPRQATISNGSFSAWLAGGWYDSEFVPPTPRTIRIWVPTNAVTLTFNECAALATNTSITPSAGINGRYIQAGTVNSNAFDAATKAQLALAGTGGTNGGAQQTNWPWAAITNAPDVVTNGQSLVDVTISAGTEDRAPLVLETGTDTAPSLDFTGGGGLIGRLWPGGLTNWLPGDLAAGTFHGNGAGLTNVAAAALVGAVAEADHATWSDYAEYVTYVTNRIAFATNAENAQSAATVSGVISLTNLPAGVLTNNQSGVTLSGAFEGSGYSLSNVFSQAGFRSVSGFPIANVTSDSPEEYGVTWNTIGFSATNVSLSGQFSGSFAGNAAGLTNLPASSLTGLAPTGVVATIPAAGNGWILSSSNGIRNWSRNGGMLTNLVAPAGMLSNNYNGVVVVSNLVVAQSNANVGLVVSNGANYVVVTNGAIKSSGWATFVGLINTGGGSVNFSSGGDIYVGDRQIYGTGWIINKDSGFSWNSSKVTMLGGLNIGATADPGAGNVSVKNNLTVTTLSAGTITATNGVINYGTGWAGTTNGTAPADTTTIRAWINYTNTSGGVFKMPLYQ